MRWSWLAVVGPWLGFDVSVYLKEGSGRVSAVVALTMSAFGHPLCSESRKSQMGADCVLSEDKRCRLRLAATLRGIEDSISVSPGVLPNVDSDVTIDQR
jgi:hypothetical protein